MKDKIDATPFLVHGLAVAFGGRSFLGTIDQKGGKDSTEREKQKAEKLKLNGCIQCNPK